MFALAMKIREAIVKIAGRQGHNPTQLPLEPQITTEPGLVRKAELCDSKSLRSSELWRR
jgi:hypothetical protein